MKKAIIAILIIVAGIGMYRVVKFTIGKLSPEKAVEETKGIPVKAVAAKKIDMLEKLKLSGNIVGIEVVNVFSQVPGKINDIFIREGEKVGKGGVLFKIDRDIVGMEYNLAAVESPINGYVGKIMVDRGMTISPATPLAEVVNMSEVEAVVRLMEEDINKVKIGMQALIKTGTYPDDVFTGIVYKKSAVLDQVSRTQEVRIRIDNRALKLKHGMFADAEIILKKMNAVIVVPDDSVFRSVDGSPAVYKVVKNRAVLQKIISGVSFDNFKEITKGIAAGDLIITLGRENVLEGNSLIVYREDIDKIGGMKDEEE
ncbi:MAG: efflux RND transporter periplasmic adaptor subunit [Spirochaetes bacterium]|jgi:multidrug efflux pump subunit AcrA (membrane-fusion protein)|nr:efflux RND transporter periplasmic adaptor subunit [Spirochaetota bacterium]